VHACRELAQRLAGKVVFFIFAGTDTTTQMILRAMIALVQHPQWLQVLGREQDRLLAEFGDAIDRKARPNAAHACMRGQHSQGTCMHCVASSSMLH
jgi:cytochrome P450